MTKSEYISKLKKAIIDRLKAINVDAWAEELVKRGVIEDGGSICYKHDVEKEWRHLFMVGGVPDFTYLEHKAPFTDKNGGELYAGDKARVEVPRLFNNEPIIYEGIIVFIDSLGITGGWFLVYNKGKSHHAIQDNEVITKLGNIHEESCND